MEVEPSKTSDLAVNIPSELGKEGFPSSRHWWWIVTVLLVYFGARLVFFAVTISGSVPPDETTHLGIIRVFSKVLWLPVNSPETYHLGLVTNIPWLYYWLMGKSLALNFFGIPDLLFLRLLNLPLAFATVYFVWRTVQLLTNDRLTQILVIVAMTNTLMFSFLSAAVSYDNLTNLFAAMAIYNLCAFFKERSGIRLGFSLCCQLAGGVTKASLLPLMLILNIVLLFHESRNFRNLPSSLAVYCKTFGRKSCGLLFVTLVLLALSVQLYGGNYLQYNKIKPQMSEVLPFENVIKNRIATREMIIELFKDGRVSYDQAIEMTALIKHAGDREATVSLVSNLMQRRYNGGSLLSPVEYIAPWSRAMLASIYGILAHKNMLNRGMLLVPVIVLIVLSAVALLVRCRPGEVSGIPASLAVIAVSYASFLMYFINYEIYQYVESIFAALQGRYIFPVIGPFYILSFFYLMRLFRGERARLAVAVLAAFIFIASDLPFFLTHVSPDWFARPLW